MISQMVQSYQLGCQQAGGDSVPQLGLSMDEIDWMVTEVDLIHRCMKRRLQPTYTHWSWMNEWKRNLAPDKLQGHAV